MNCPQCGNERSYVYETRKNGLEIRRTRICDKPDCEHRWTTYETTIDPKSRAARNVTAKLAKRLRSLAQEIQKTALTLDELSKPEAIVRHLSMKDSGMPKSKRRLIEGSRH